MTFVVGYAPTETQSVGRKHAFWTVLERAVKEVPEHEQLFVLMDASVRTGRRGRGKLGSEECKVIGAIAEILSTIMVSESCHFLPIMSLHS